MPRARAEDHGDFRRITWSGGLDLEGAAELRRHALQTFEAGLALELVIEEAGDLELVWVQSLCTVAADAAARGLDFRFDPGSAAQRLRRLADFAGLPDPTPAAPGTGGLRW